VVQTRDGYEAVRCSGLPEKLTFDRVPAGLSAKPVFTINTRDAEGGTYRVTLTYLAWGFDWQAHYVATLDDRAAGSSGGLKLMSWLTVLNDNNQSFADATLLVVAGKLNVTSDLKTLAAAPAGRGLQLVCYPLGSTAAGSPIRKYSRESRQPINRPNSLTVMSSPQSSEMLDTVMAAEEQLGDLKLYRVPERMSVAAKGLKQVAFLQRDGVKAGFVYTADCFARAKSAEPTAAGMLLKTRNDAAHGLGVALPSGGVTIFEPSSAGDLLIGEQNLRDYAVGQDVEIQLGQSNQVFSACKRLSRRHPNEAGARWTTMQSTITNANQAPINFQLSTGRAQEWKIGKIRGHEIKDGMHVINATIPAGGTKTVKWKVKLIEAD